MLFISISIEPAGLSIMYNSFVQSCLECNQLLYFGAAKSHLDHLDALQHQTAGISHCTFPSLESRRHATAIGLTCQLLHGEGRGLLILNLLPMLLENHLS